MRPHGRVMVGAGLVAVLLVGACSTVDKAAREDHRAFGAEHLGDPYADYALADVLNRDEREAAERAGIRVGAGEGEAGLATDEASGAMGSGDEPVGDRAGRVGVTALSVGVTLGMLVAPFFLY